MCMGLSCNTPVNKVKNGREDKEDTAPEKLALEKEIRAGNSGNECKH